MKGASFCCYCSKRYCRVFMLSCFSHVWLFVTPWTAACHALLSMGFSRQEYWSGLPCPSPGKRVFTVTVNFSFFSISGWGIDLDYCDVEWFALITTKIILLFLRLHPSTAFWTLIDYGDYSISSKGFFPTVVGIMVIWIEFTYSLSILVHWFLRYRCLLLPSPAWPRPVYLD